MKTYLVIVTLILLALASGTGNPADVEASSLSEPPVMTGAVTAGDVSPNREPSVDAMATAENEDTIVPAPVGCVAVEDSFSGWVGRLVEDD